MNPYISSNWGDNPVVQTWQQHGARYRSPFEYTCDPIANKVMQTWNDRDDLKEYSSPNKAFYPVVPIEPISIHHVSLMGDFDRTRLKQTDVLSIINSQNPTPHQSQAVSLAATISPLLNKMGTMKDPINGDKLGTCTLIAHNLVLVARHAIAGRDIRNMIVKFGYTEHDGCFYCADQTRFCSVYEENALLDYAIIQLEKPLGNHLGFATLNTEGYAASDPALLHYPLGKPLKVSVHTWAQTPFQTDYLLAYHDSDYYSSGGAYFDTNGSMIAMHLGTEMARDMMSLLRYARPLEVIVRRNPHSLLNILKMGEFYQSKSYISDLVVTYLIPADHNYLIDEEGRESEKVLRGLLKNELKKDKNIKLNKNGTINFSKQNIEYIAQTYPKKHDIFIEECLGTTGLHKSTHHFSVVGQIESDHTLPHDVWKTTKHPKMKKVAVGRGKRPGENNMPAITIPWEIHRHLETTVSQPFRDSLTKLCDKGKVNQALIKCYEDYENKGLNFPAYKSAIKASLNEHVDLGLISKQQKADIIKKFF